MRRALEDMNIVFGSEYTVIVCQSVSVCLIISTVFDISGITTGTISIEDKTQDLCVGYLRKL